MPNFFDTFELPAPIAADTMDVMYGAYDKKQWNLEHTIEEKYNLLQKLGLQKQATLAEGYRRG